MALAFVSKTTGTQTTSGASAVTASVTPSANTLYLVSVFVRNGNSLEPGLPTVTGCGLTWTRAGDSYFDISSTSRKRVFVFWAYGAAPTAGSLTITFPESETNIMWAITEVTGASGIGNVVASPGTGTAVTSISLSPTYASASNGVFAAYGNDTETGNYTAGSGMTQLDNQPTGNTNGRLFTQYATGNVSPVTVAQSPSEVAGGVAVEIIATTTGGTVTPTTKFFQFF